MTPESLIEQYGPRESMEYDVVIVGGGQAAAAAAEELRNREFDGEIVLLSNEQEYPYERPPLSKEYLAGKKELGDFTRTIESIAPGTRAYVDGPHGVFSPDNYDGPGFVFLGGGLLVSGALKDALGEFDAAGRAAKQRKTDLAL